MQPQLGIGKRFIRSLSEVDRCSLRLGSGRVLLDVYLGWTDAASAWDPEDLILKVSQGWTDVQPQMGIWKRFIRSF